MKQNNLCGNRRHMHPGRLLRAALCCILALSAPGSGIAQNYAIPYSFPDDVKMYSTEMVPNYNSGNGPNETVMAGTIYQSYFPGSPAVVIFPAVPYLHYMHIWGNNGGISQSFKIQDSRFSELRAIDIAVNTVAGTDYYYITAIGRDINTSQNCIAVYKMDNTTPSFPAAPLEQLVVTNTATGANKEGDLYPTHSLIYNDRLYICGYQALGATSSNDVPDYSTPKEAFVIGIDLASGMSAVNASISWDYSSNGAYDYDIPMRMTLIQDGAQVGNIHVTGSCNGEQNWWAPYVFWRSATMNVVLDASTLNKNIDNPFMWQGQPEFYSNNEYGISMYEDVNNKLNYIVGNGFPNPEQSEGGSHDGFQYAQPMSFYVAKIDHNSFAVDPVRSVNGNGNALALQTLPSATSGLASVAPTPQGGPALNSNFLITGMTYAFGNCNVPTDYLTGNMDPFIIDMSAQWGGSGNECMAFDGFHVYTIDPSSTGNYAAYTGLGGPLTEVYWNPTFAARRSTSDDIIMNAPKIMNSTLGLKWLSVNGGSYTFTSGYDCYHDNNCAGVGSPGNYFIMAPQNNITVANGNTANLQITADPALTGVVNDYDYAHGSPCADNGNYTYKPSDVKKLERTMGLTSIYPNPAHTFIQVALDKAIADNAPIKVDLVNMAGQQVKLLYEGSAVRLNASNTLNLPDVAPGVYNVRITNDKKLIHQQKLSVQ